MSVKLGEVHDVPLKVKENSKLSNNVVNYLPEVNESKLEVFYNGKSIALGSELQLPKIDGEEVIEFSVSNTGGGIVSFYGIPQILLGKQALPNKSRRLNASSKALSGYSTVLSEGQPNKLTLKPSETARFNVVVNPQLDGEPSVIVNIPNSDTYPEVYWFKLIVLNSAKG